MKDLTRIDDRCRAQHVDKDNRTVRFLAQSTALASDDLVILAYAGRKHNKDYMKNPIVVPYHMRLTPDGEPVVVGSVVETEFTDEGMFQTVKFADIERAEQYWKLYSDGHMRMVSIAWSSDYKAETDPKKMKALLDKSKVKLRHEDWNRIRGVITEYRQRDLSLVAIGADPKAIARSEPSVVGELLANYNYDQERGLYLGEDPPKTRIHIDMSGLAPLNLKKDQIRDFVSNITEEINKGLEHGPAVIEFTEPSNPPSDSSRFEPDADEEDQDDMAVRLFDMFWDMIRGVIPYKKYPLAPEGQAWDASAQVRRAEVDDLKKMCTWFDSENPDIKGSYKLPHHTADGYKTVWRGVAAAMAVVFGARGGLKGKAVGDRRGIYNHLKKHYADFDKEAPEFRADMTKEDMERVLADLLKDVTEADLDNVLLDLSDSSSAEPGHAPEPNGDESNEPDKPRNPYEDLLGLAVEKTRGVKIVSDDLLALAKNEKGDE